MLCRNRWLTTQNARTNKTLWTEEEDKVLREIVQEFGIKRWTTVAINFNKKFPEKDRKGKQCRDRWLNYLDPDIKKYRNATIRRTDITISEKYNLCYNWLHQRNSWVKIARTMGRTENWVKNNWKKLLKKENIVAASPEELAKRVTQLMESLRALDQSLPPPQVDPPPFDASYADVPEELEISETSKSGLSETSYGIQRHGPAPCCLYTEAVTRRTKLELMQATVHDSRGYIDGPTEKREEDKVRKKKPREEAGGQRDQCMEMDGVYVSTESDEYDFAANTSEKPGTGEDVDMYVRDVSKYTMKDQRGSSPFENNKRTII